MKRLLIALTFVLLSVAQVPPTQLTNGLVNGHFWNSVPSDTAKLGIVVGAVNTTKYYANLGEAANSQSKLVDNMVPDGTMGDIKDELDIFYRPPENRLLPLPVVIPLLAIKTRMDPLDWQRKVNNEIAIWRNWLGR